MEEKTLSVEELKRLIPQKLHGQSRWVVWKREGGKNLLYQPSEHRLAQAYPNDPYTWDSLDEALRALLYNPVFSQAHAQRQAGLALVNSRATPLVTITLYGALRQGGKLSPWVLPYFDVLDAYAEEGVVPGSVTFLWEGPQEPFSKGNFSVASPPYIMLTLRKIAGSPSRVGTAPTRYRRFLEMVEEWMGKLQGKVAERYAEHGPAIAGVLGGLVPWGLWWREERRAVSRCPVCRAPKATLTLALEDKLYMSCVNGCTPQDVVQALGVEWDDRYFSAKAPKESPAFAPLQEPEAYSLVEEAYMALFGTEATPKLLLDYGVNHELATSLFLGLRGEEIVLPFLEDEGEGKVLYSYTVVGGAGEVLSSVPPEGGFWASPGYRTASALMVAFRPLLALGLWGVLSKDPRKTWGVVYATSPHHLASLVRRSGAGEVYFWPGEELRLVGEMTAGLRNLPVRARVCPPTAVPFKNRPEAVKVVQEAVAQAEPVVL